MPEVIATVSTALKVAKEAVALAKQYKDTPLYQKLVDLQSQVVELSSERIELVAKIQSLEDQLAQRAKASFRRPYWFEEGDAVPLCPQCYESSDGKTRIHLSHPAEEWRGGHRRECTNCHNFFFDEGKEPPRTETQIRPVVRRYT